MPVWSTQQGRVTKRLKRNADLSSTSAGVPSATATRKGKRFLDRQPTLLSPPLSPAPVPELSTRCKPTAKVKPLPRLTAKWFRKTTRFGKTDFSPGGGCLGGWPPSTSRLSPPSLPVSSPKCLQIPTQERIREYRVSFLRTVQHQYQWDRFLRRKADNGTIITEIHFWHD